MFRQSACLLATRRSEFSFSGMNETSLGDERHTTSEVKDETCGGTSWEDAREIIRM